MTTGYPIQIVCALREVLLILLFWAALVDGAEPAAGGGPAPGTYRDDRLILELNSPSESGDGGIYTGVIQLGEEKFPFRAGIEQGRLKGTFESLEGQFEFIGSVVGRMIVFTTGGTTYRLKKESPNPLAKPNRPNPLSQPRVTPIGEDLPKASAPSVKPAKNAISLKRYSILDGPSMIGGEAFSLLIPADWQVEGGLVWRVHPVVPASVTLRVRSPDRLQMLEAFPAISFVWREGGIPLFPPGSSYLGNEVAEPVQDAVAYIRQVTLKRFRQELSFIPMLLAAEELPKVSEAIAETAQEPGLQKTFHAARLRLEYVENGRPMEEEIYCVLGSTYAPAIRTTFWGADRNYAFKAERGKLESGRGLFQTMVSSFRPNLRWFNRYVQLVQLLGQSPVDSTVPVSELSRFIAQTSHEIYDPYRQLYERQRINQERVNATLSRYVRGTAEFRDLVENRIVELPSGYEEVWINARGDYFLSEDLGSKPGSDFGEDWRRVERVR